MSNVCHHGQLARSCYTCEQNAEISTLRAKLTLLIEAAEDAMHYIDDRHERRVLRQAITEAEKP